MRQSNQFKNLVITGLIVLNGCIITTLLGTTLFYGNRMTATYAPLADAVMEIKLKITSGHLWVEEIFSGDPHHTMDEVRGYLDAANWYANAILEGGENATLKFQPLTDEGMRWKIKEVRRKLKQFRKVTEQRFEMGESAAAGSDIDQLYDLSFNDLLTQADSVETQLHLLMKNELDFFNGLMLILIFMVVISLVSLIILFNQYHRRETNHKQELEAVKQRMNQTLDHLQEEVSKRTWDLTRVNTNLKELDRLKSLFITSVSDELRTPINTITNASNQLRGLDSSLDEGQLGHLQRIEESGRKLLSLINGVIDIFKIEAGTLQAKPTPFELHDMVNETSDQLHLELEAKGLSLHTSLSRNVEMYTDRYRLAQCVLNLLRNAIKFSEEGEIRLSTRIDGPNLEIAVEDDGIGIDRMDLQRLFQPFERFANAEKHSGSGLGLYLTKKIATDLLHGDLSAESQVGVGSRFTLRIPMQLEIA